MSLYGNLIMYFCSQFVDLLSFDMLPKINSGYDTEKDRDGIESETVQFRGVFQNLSSNIYKDVSGNAINSNSGNLWTDRKLKLGSFVRDEDNFVYRVQKELAWVKESSFYYYEITQVVGDDGSNTTLVTLETGKEHFN